jgi:hypothetical protein
MKTYLYTISRRDLPLAQQAVQAAHAAIEYARLFMGSETDHPSYIHLTVRDRADLIRVRSLLSDAGPGTAEFHEPHDGWGLTAVAVLLGEGQRHLLRGLPLWRLPTQATYREAA